MQKHQGLGGRAGGLGQGDQVLPLAVFVSAVGPRSPEPGSSSMDSALGELA